MPRGKKFTAEQIVWKLRVAEHTYYRFKRAVQSACEQIFLWPALRDAAGAMMEQLELERLEYLSPTLSHRNSIAIATILIYSGCVGSGRR